MHARDRQYIYIIFVHKREMERDLNFENYHTDRDGLCAGVKCERVCNLVTVASLKMCTGL